MAPTKSLLQAALAAGIAFAQCPDYSSYSTERHPPFSNGKYHLSYMRPDPACRTFNSSDVEDVLVQMQSVITDPDLYRLFENTYPSTLDTAIKWRGFAANNSEEELTFVITGDIDAMWLRDSANQVQPYRSLIKANDSSSDGLASLFRGVINIQARYLLFGPFCNAFQAPVESGIPPAENGAAVGVTVKPEYDNSTVFECKYELDSLAAFLEVSTDYYAATEDVEFFGKFQWLSAVRAVLDTAKAMLAPTYGEDPGSRVAIHFPARTERRNRQPSGKRDGTDSLSLPSQRRQHTIPALHPCQHDVFSKFGHNVRDRGGVR